MKAQPLVAPRPATISQPAAVPPAPADIPVAPLVVEEVSAPTSDEAEPASWPDDAAESAFRAEARDRGEPVKATPVAVEIAEESEPKALPKLDALVERIPADVRDTLEELFRAKFVRVQRVPKRVLKT